MSGFTKVHDNFETLQMQPDEEEIIVAAPCPLLDAVRKIITQAGKVRGPTCGFKPGTWITLNEKTTLHALPAVAGPH